MAGRSLRRAVSHRRNPGDRQLLAGHGRGRGRRRAGREGLLARVGPDGLAGARADPPQRRRHHGRPPVRPGGADGLRGREEPARGARRRAGDGRAHPVELRRGGEARRVPDPDERSRRGRRLLRRDAPVRRVGRDQPVQLPDGALRRALLRRAGRGQLRGPQAVEPGSAARIQALRVLPRRRRARRGVPSGRRARRGRRGGAVEAPRRRRDHLHRLVQRRDGHLQELRGERAEARDLRDGRQEPDDRDEERRPGQGDRRGPAERVRVRWAEVLRVLARVRRARGLRRLPHAAQDEDREDQGWQPVGARRVPRADHQRGRYGHIRGGGRGGPEERQHRHRRAADHRGRARQGTVRRADGGRGARRQLDLEEGALRPVRCGSAVRRARRRDPEGQRDRVRADRRVLQRGRGRGRRMARPYPGRGDLRQPSRGIDHRRLAGRAAVRWLEGIGHDGEGRRRAVLRDAVPPRAVPDGDRGVSAGESRLAYDGLSAFVGPKLITEVPGPEAMAWIERDRKVTSPSLPRAYPFVPKRGAGSIVEDVDGNIFLDLNAGIAVTSTGHCHPKVVDAIDRQAAELLHYSASDFFLPVYAEVCERLDQMAPFRDRPARSFLTNSGTEAVEAAIKLARFATGRQYLIGMYQSFHGRSMGSVTLTASKAKYRTNFGPMLPSVYHSFYGDFDYLEEVLFKRIVSPTEVAAIVVESWLGEGGYVLPPDGWFTYLRELCDRHGILLVCDEVQSGMGRSGKMWAIEHEGAEPDILISGKGIASGLPLGAMIAREDLMVWDLGSHGSTYGGSPLSCAAALATFDVIRDEDLLGNADRVGSVLLDGLREMKTRHPLIREVRGKAMWIGLGFADHEVAEAVEHAAFRRGLLMLSCGDDAIRVSPPLVFREDQAREALRLFEEVVAEVESVGA